MSHPTRDPVRDAGEEAQRAAEAHLEACQAVLYAEEEGPDPEADGLELLETPAVGPYCGCTTCDVRETLAAAWPIVVADCAAIVELAGHPEAAKLLQSEAARMALPHTPLHAEGVHA